MPDISMCMNHECPVHRSCYRYTATPNDYWQAYADFKPDEDGVCIYFIPNDEVTKEAP